MHPIIIKGHKMLNETPDNMKYVDNAFYYLLELNNIKK